MSLNSHRNLGMTGSQQARSAARLSSGFRINSAADDAAGLAISEKMRSQIRGLDQASRNGQDGISLIQTAEGAMATVNEMVTRIRELVIQAANDTNAHDGDNLVQSDRMQIQREINQLLEEIDEVTLRTEFNTRTLLDGSLSSGATGLFADIQALSGVAPDAITNAQEAQDFIDLLGHLQTFYNITGIDLGVPANNAEVLEIIAVLDALETFAQNGTQAAADDLNTALTDVDASLTFASVFGVSWTAAADPVDAAEAQDLIDSLATANRWMNRIGDPAEGGGIWFQIGANMGQGIRLSIESVDVAALDAMSRNHTLTVDGFHVADLRNEDLTDDFGVMREDGELIDQFVAALDAALAHVSGERAHLGAVQNRLEFTIENLDTASENLQAANSRIRDADMAREMMRFTQSNVLQQAAISMLAQANMAPQNILQLLG